MTTLSKGTETPTNPLAKYFRVPGLSVQLPTKGRFLPEGTFLGREDGVVDVLPMTAADELLLKNPEALLSGHAIERMVESCVPSIKATGMISTPDLDVLLLAIRAATYGPNMEVQAICPTCGHENAFDCHLPSLLQTMKTIDEDNPVRLSDDVVAYVRPYTFKDASKLSMATFEETRKVQAIDAEEEPTDEKRVTQMKASMDVITKLSSQLLAQCIIKIVTPDAEVTEPAFIAEFMGNITRQWVAKIEETLREMNETGIDKSVKVQCTKPGCEHEWETSLEFDPSSFFGSGS